MEFVVELFINSLERVWLTWLHNWPYLAISAVVATLLKLYISEDKVSKFLNRKRGAGVLAATAAAVATPLCSCGTTAVVLGMIVSNTSWAPVVAFMVASPLTSPEGLFYTAGLFGWPFSIAFFLASIVLGLAGGWIAAILENRGWLDNQVRNLAPGPAACSCSSQPQTYPSSAPVFNLVATGPLMAEPASLCGCSQPAPLLQTAACGCSQAEPVQLIALTGTMGESPANPAFILDTARPAVTPGLNLNVILIELYNNSKYLVFMFTSFAFLGYFLNGLIPASWVEAVFGNGRLYNIPLAATLGLPLYINSETALPMIRALIDAGMSQGAALAFIIVGAGTSIGAISGALSIARWRVVLLVVAVLWIGAILSGFAFNMAVGLHLF